MSNMAENHMIKLVINDCKLFITTDDALSVHEGGKVPDYVTVQMDDWYSADYPLGIDDEAGMLEHMLDILMDNPDVAVYEAVDVIWAQLGETRYGYELDPTMLKDYELEADDQVVYYGEDRIAPMGEMVVPPSEVFDGVLAQPGETRYDYELDPTMLEARIAPMGEIMVTSSVVFDGVMGVSNNTALMFITLPDDRWIVCCI